MPVPWSALFSAIPWGEVIARAPEVAQGARKLWQKVGKREAPTGAPAPAPAITPEARIAELESQLLTVTRRQQESAELLASLAEQNADLVRATEELRARVRQLGIASAVLGVGLIAAFIAVALRTG